MGGQVVELNDQSYKIKWFSLREYLWKRKFGYTPKFETTDIKWTVVNTHGLITVPLEMLRPSIHTERGNIRVPVEQTPHYAWIKDLVDGKDDTLSRAKYRSYIENYHSDAIDVAKSIELHLANVVKLVDEYKSTPHRSNSITIITSAPKRKWNICQYNVKIYDGVHRAAIAMALGHKAIRCMIK